jgi:hypothetical protein
MGWRAQSGVHPHETEASEAVAAESWLVVARTVERKVQRLQLGHFAAERRDAYPQTYPSNARGGGWHLKGGWHLRGRPLSVPIQMPTVRPRLSFKRRSESGLELSEA